MPIDPTQPLPLEPDYNRFVDPITDDAAPPAVDDDLQDALSSAVGGDGTSDGLDVSEDADGGATVSLEVDEKPADDDFYANLAETLDSSALSAAATELLDQIERDKEARKRRDELYAEGIKRTGLGNEAPGGAEFTGASRAVHPVLAEGCIDFAARAMKELFPAKGPCKTQIIGDATDEKLERAERKRQYMNWQLTTQIKEFRSEFEQLLTQEPLGGSQYLKLWQDTRLRRPRVEFVPIDDVYLPFAVTDFRTAHRVTHRQQLTRQTFDQRIASGLYRAINVDDPSMAPEPSAAQSASDTIEGRDDDAYNSDGLRTVFEVQLDYDFEKANEIRPYLVTIDDHTRQVLAVYRNWEPDDETYAKLACMVEFKFIPWRGAYALGLPHIIGSLAGALTGGLRALLDSAHINNAASMMKLKGARVSGQNVQVEIGQVSEIEGPAGIDDIRKLAMPIPFNPPSQVLFNLLEWITDQAKGVVNTAEEKIADASANAPVGTTLALIEQGSVTFSSIHSRNHASMAEVLDIIHRLNARFIDDEETVEELGDLVVYQKDFVGPRDIIPVSDPNIFSEAQRYALLQAVFALADKYPQFYDLRKLNERALKQLNYPDAEDVLVGQKDAEYLDPITENVVASRGDQPLKAYGPQDHIAHLNTHLHYALSPIFCANPLMAMPALPLLINHCKEHLVFMYEAHARAAAGAMTALNLGSDSEDSMSKAVAFADQELAQQLGQQIMPMLTQAQALMQKLAPPPQLPPELQTKKDMQAAELQATAVEAQKQREVDLLKHKDEMATAERNANIAAQAEIEDSKTRLVVDQMKELMQNYRLEQQHQQNVWLAQLEGRNTEQLEQLRADHAMALEAMKQLLSAQQAAMPDVSAALAPALERLAATLLDSNAQTQTGLTKVGDAVSALLDHQRAPRAPLKLIFNDAGDPVGLQ